MSKFRHRLSKRNKIIIICVVAAVVLVAGSLAIWFLVYKDESKQNTPIKAGVSKSNENEEDLPAATPADPTPTTHKSTKLNLEFTHRADWSVKEAADGEVNITSPRVTYIGQDGQAAPGTFTLKIRKGVSETAQSIINRSIASRDSEVIAYKEPTDQQRFYTSVSYAGGAKDVFNFLIVTGSIELKKDNSFDYALSFDSDSFLIVGGFGNVQPGSMDFETVPLENIDTAAKDQAISIIESLKIH